MFSEEKSSFPRKPIIFIALLLSLLLSSGCDSSPSSNQNGQNIGTPLPTIAARNPEDEPPFCTGRQDQTTWSGPDNVRQVDSAVPPPVTPGLTGGYSVGDFDAPCIMPKVGVVRIEIFISDKLVGGYVYGEGRGFDPKFDPADTKAAILLDFTKGNAQVIVAPTCHGKAVKPNPLGKPTTIEPDCTHAYPLSGVRGHGHNWFRWKVDPKLPGFPNGTEFLSLQYEFTNPTLRGFGGSYAQYLSPAINGLILFAFEPDTGYVCVKGTIDDFPAVAIHQVHYDADGKVSAVTKPVTLADHKESESLLGLMDPFHWTETHIGNQCGQRLTGLTPTQPLKFGTIKAFAGNGILGAENVGDDGPATSAFVQAMDVVVDSANNVYLADYKCRIRKVSPQGIITTIAGNGTYSSKQEAEGLSATQEAVCPTGIAIGPDGSLYVSDGARVRKISANGVITTVAGTGTRGYSGDGGPAISATLMAPHGLAFDNSGNLYIADYDARAIRRVDGRTGIITTLVTTGQPVPENATGHGLSGPLGIAVSPITGDIVFSDYNAEVVYRIDPKDDHLTVIAGIESDGPGVTPATQRELFAPGYIRFDDIGALYIPKVGQVVRLDPSMQKLDTIAGNNSFGCSGDGGPALNAQLGLPDAVALDSFGNLYIAEYSCGVVRIVYAVE